MPSVTNLWAVQSGAPERRTISSCVALPCPSHIRATQQKPLASWKPGRLHSVRVICSTAPASTTAAWDAGLRDRPASSRQASSTTGQTCCSVIAPYWPLPAPAILRCSRSAAVAASAPPAAATASASKTAKLVSAPMPADCVRPSCVASRRDSMIMSSAPASMLAWRVTVCRARPRRACRHSSRTLGDLPWSRMTERVRLMPPPCIMAAAFSGSMRPLEKRQ
mmetsp:Transcript_19665/g.62352  ORF Transcript_19665/g.62352 Transcript_19665/m.62352 type:complete len:222 (-) Transcript_19665:643-1308(-)